MANDPSKHAAPLAPALPAGVPLRFRVPNPAVEAPADLSLAAQRALSAGRCVALVGGPPVVCAAAAARALGERRDTAIWIACSERAIPSDDLGSALSRLGLALAEACGVAAPPNAPRDDVIAWLLDLADAHCDALVVHGWPYGAALAAECARYGRRARWLFTMPRLGPLDAEVPLVVLEVAGTAAPPAPSATGDAGALECLRRDGRARLAAGDGASVAAELVRLGARVPDDLWPLLATVAHHDHLPIALADVPRPPVADDPALAVEIARTWARVCVARGAIDDAIAALAAAEMHAPALRFDRLALLVEVGRGPEARALLDALGDALEARGTEARLLGARLALLEARLGEARLEFRRVADDPETSPEARFDAASGLSMTGDLRAAAAALRARPDDPVDVDLSAFGERVRAVRIERANLRVEAADLAGASAELDAIRPAFAPSSPRGLEVALLRGIIAKERGELRRAASVFAEVAATAAAAGHPKMHHVAHSFVTWIERLSAAPISPDPTGRNPFEIYAAIYRIRDADYRARAGEPVDPPPTDDLVEPRTLAYAHQVAVHCACAALGYPDRPALAPATLPAIRSGIARGIEAVAEPGFVLRSLDARAAQLDLLLVLGAHPAFVDALREHAETPRLEATRHRLEHGFFGAVAAGLEQGWAPDPFLPVAQHASALPGPRRARALLGVADVPLDAVDRAVVAAAAAALGGAFVRTADAPTWWLDRAARRVWVATLEGVVSHDLSRRRSVWGVLEVLCAGPADAEAVHDAVWGAVPYHPLDHDNRIRLAVHKLRKLVEDDAGPARVVTVDGPLLAYRLDGLAVWARSE